MKPLAALMVIMPLAVVAQGADRPPPPARVDRFGDPLPPGILARMGSVRLDCEDDVDSAVFAPDGKSLSVATSARDKQLWVLDVAPGKTIRRLTLPEGPRQHAMTPDSRFLAVRTFYQKSLNPNQAGVHNFGEIHVLDATSGKVKWKTDAK